MKHHNEMIASQLANWLEEELKHLKEHAGVGTFFAVAARNLNEKDFNSLVKAAKTEAKRLRKKANGCPSRIWDWRRHYN